MGFERRETFVRKMLERKRRCAGGVCVCQISPPHHGNRRTKSSPRTHLIFTVKSALDEGVGGRKESAAGFYFSVTNGKV